MDEDLATAVDLSPGSLLRISFVGAPRWVDRIELTISGGACDILVRDWNDEEIFIGSRVGDVEKRMIVDFEAMRTEELVLHVPATSGPVQVNEISASFFKGAIDTDTIGTLEEGDDRQPTPPPRALGWYEGGPYVGLSLLDPDDSANLTLIDNATYVHPLGYVTDEDKFPFLSAGDPAHVVTQSDGPADWSVLASAGPFAVSTEGVTVAFAVAVADSPQELSDNLEALRHYYSGTAPTGLPSVGDGSLVTRLLGAAPNPLNPRTSIRFDLAKRQAVRLQILDVGGRVVTTLLDGVTVPGRHSVPWDGRASSGAEIASGIYFLRFEAGDVRETRKISVSK